MVIATHLIKIKGKADIFIWPEKKLKNHVIKKIKMEIEPSFHASLELFKLDSGNVEVWVFVSALPSEVSKNIVEKWLSDHIMEKGLKVDSFEIKEVASLTDANVNKNMFIVLE